MDSESDLDELSKHIKQQDENIFSIEKVTFIKPSDPNDQPFMINFTSNHMPDSLDIGGPVILRPWINRPLMCKNCYEYGHSKKTCKKQNQICRKCAGEGHDDLQTNKCRLPDYCIHCQTDEHPTNYIDCPRRKCEQEIVDIQQRDGVSFLRARQTYKDNSNVVIHTRPKQQNYETHFDLTVEKEAKRKLTPWALEKAIEHHLGNKAISISSRNDTTFLVEVDNKKDQTEKIMKLERVLDYECKVTPANNIYHPQGIAFVYEQNIESKESFEKFQKEFIKYHKVLNVVKASWIIPREGQKSTAILITFSGELPNYIDIPKEKKKNKSL